MAVRNKNAHWKLSDIQPRHWDAVAKQAGLGGAAALRAEIAESVAGAVASVTARLPKGFPAHVAEAIFNRLTTSAVRTAKN